MSKYKRTLEELKKNAVLHWPEEILKKAGDISVLPKLLQTQDSFISILKVADKDPWAWKSVLDSGKALTGPLFLKHLMVLTDIGGEALNKLPPLKNYCPGGILSFDWGHRQWEYRFKEIQDKCALTNLALQVDSKKLLESGDFTDKMFDVAMLLLFASTGVNDSLPPEIKERCIAGALIGRPEELDRFAKENYIRVSRQVGGATANALGQFAQDYVVTHLKQALPDGWTVSRDSSLPGVAHTQGGGNTNFDLVIQSPKNKYFGVEVSFQVTTNSVIERKAREAQSLVKKVHKAGHKICYVIDGAGNINIRATAVGTLCEHSDCTVSMSVEEIRHLANYLKNVERKG